MSSLTMPRLPLELILQISKYIDNPTLVTFLCVCRDWHSLLLPLCYRSISRTQWHHPTFPLRDPARLHDPALAALLAQIHSFEWFSNTALTDGGIEASQLREKQPEGKRQFMPGRQVPTPQLMRMLGMMTQTLSTLIVHHRSPWLGETLTPVILQLDRLTTLHLSFEGGYEFAPLLTAEKTWVPLLSRLEELELGGQPRMLRMNEVVRQQILALAPLPWKMKTLKVPTWQMGWAEFCPLLKWLEIDHRYSSTYGASGSITPDTTPLGVWCPVLETLKLTGWSREEHTYNQGLVVASLKRLKSLTLNKRLRKDIFDFLIPGKLAQQNSETIGQEEGLPCPMLEHLEVPIRPERFPTDTDATSPVCLLLRARPKLKRLVLPSARCDPRVVFALSSSSGQGAGEGESDTEIVCMDLEHLAIGLYPPSTGWRFQPTVALPKQEHEVFWRIAFQQLCGFRKLRLLSLVGRRIDRSIALEELEKVGGWPCLERLIVSDEQVSEWGREELRQWMELLPSLKWMHLKPVKFGHLEEIAKWMAELGYGHVTVSMEGWDTVKY
ncbi:hypothetical protein MVEG_08916 [Podila verticillata NRRL 6337]|nr:hypothetical protein MVEG_08916 [Podila verticillata NRRL 6337]